MVFIRPFTGKEKSWGQIQGNFMMRQPHAVTVSRPKMNMIPMHRMRGYRLTHFQILQGIPAGRGWTPLQENI